MNAEMIEAAKADNATTETPTTAELPQTPVRFRGLALEKFADGGEVFLTGYCAELKANVKIDDTRVVHKLIELGAKPSETVTKEVPAEVGGTTTVFRKMIKGFAIDAVVTGLVKKQNGSYLAYIKNATPEKAGLILEGDWAL